MESPSVEVFNNRGDVSLRDMAIGLGGDELALQLDLGIFNGLFQP